MRTWPRLEFLRAKNGCSQFGFQPSDMGAHMLFPNGARRRTYLYHALTTEWRHISIDHMCPPVWRTIICWVLWGRGGEREYQRHWLVLFETTCFAALSQAAFSHSGAARRLTQAHSEPILGRLRPRALSFALHAMSTPDPHPTATRRKQYSWRNV